MNKTLTVSQFTHLLQDAIKAGKMELKMHSTTTSNLSISFSLPIESFYTTSESFVFYLEGCEDGAIQLKFVDASQECKPLEEIKVTVEVKKNITKKNGYWIHFKEVSLLFWGSNIHDVIKKYFFKVNRDFDHNRYDTETELSNAIIEGRKL
ncbi:hypothetical protein GLW08_19560 [Pontibacillus yanchengensis]|uniref:Uncharacterized protein n=2 Tax=Pontibacillus yanchengensis TaxID=462910 RepID=A0ACC7VLC1_9BACI|nr:hypothetical protein [Pontibacillus yanchengensis]MYL35554.1 hypothetical protein [Pontibacillus yanchengensis]MYL55507.1 hypothetical protein [Pontibacillus yanchengensis]